MLYDELRGLAASQLSDERSGHTLTPTALVHEAYIALVGQEASWNDRTHMLAVAGRIHRWRTEILHGPASRTRPS